ncbi:hypothetical protein SAMN04487950_3519 [Halogranum rubrum]|uniref:Uncharacterized protein n=1 Tax=Halogranum rubrum TaxID=553466 RepID=A0A1I4H069_9EURY|nr:hypothetical protein SAMN04487950_3519 [Halogranum rubrum]
MRESTTYLSSYLVDCSLRQQTHLYSCFLSSRVTAIEGMNTFWKSNRDKTAVDATLAAKHR